MQNKQSITIINNQQDYVKYKKNEDHYNFNND